MLCVAARVGGACAGVWQSDAARTAWRASSSRAAHADAAVSRQQLCSSRASVCACIIAAGCSCCSGCVCGGGGGGGGGGPPPPRAQAREHGCTVAGWLGLCTLRVHLQWSSRAHAREHCQQASALQRVIAHPQSPKTHPQRRLQPSPRRTRRHKPHTRKAASRHELAPGTVAASVDGKHHSCPSADGSYSCARTLARPRAPPPPTPHTPDTLCASCVRWQCDSTQHHLLFFAHPTHPPARAHHPFETVPAESHCGAVYTS
jgi:hypothetical protein